MAIYYPDQLRAIKRWFSLPVNKLLKSRNMDSAGSTSSEIKFKPQGLIEAINE
jgi:hypothetical protein